MVFVNVKMDIQVYIAKTIAAPSTVKYVRDTVNANSTIWIYGTIQKPNKHVVNVNPKIHIPTKYVNGTPNEALYLIHPSRNNITVKNANTIVLDLMKRFAATEVNATHDRYPPTVVSFHAPKTNNV